MSGFFFAQALIPCEGRLFDRQLAAVDEQLADRAVRVPVLVGVADAQDLAGFEPDPPRSLDLQEEEVERVVGPGDLLSGERGHPGSIWLRS